MRRRGNNKTSGLAGGACSKAFSRVFAEGFGPCAACSTRSSRPSGDVITPTTRGRAPPDTGRASPASAGPPRRPRPANRAVGAAAGRQGMPRWAGRRRAARLALHDVHGCPELVRERKLCRRRGHTAAGARDLCRDFSCSARPVFGAGYCGRDMIRDPSSTRHPRLRDGIRRDIFRVHQQARSLRKVNRARSSRTCRAGSVVPSAANKKGSDENRQRRGDPSGPSPRTRWSARN